MNPIENNQGERNYISVSVYEVNPIENSSQVNPTETSVTDIYCTWFKVQKLN